MAAETRFELVNVDRALNKPDPRDSLDRIWDEPRMGKVINSKGTISFGSSV